MDLKRLRATITHAHPEFSGSQFALLTSGWDCLAVDVDDRLIFKFPRHAGAERNLRMEAGVLALVRAAVDMPVPDLTLHPGPPLFSSHPKLRGEHLLTRHYEQMPISVRDRLAADMALFYAQLHKLDATRMEEAGARPIKSWPDPEDILRRVHPILPSGLQSYAERSVREWQALPPDPYGTTYGFFDGHGWNMAYDHKNDRLNGLYDFGDSGFGFLHQEFIYSNWIAPDLTSRIIAQYESLTGRQLDRQRIHLLSGVLRLSELADYANDPQHAPGMIQHVVVWANS